jgi:DNA-binding NtrC family response regulator
MVNKFPIGENAEQRQIHEKLSKIATTDTAVLISGPHGMGKELYARYVHQCSSRRKAAFTSVNCGILPAELLDKELFGHVGVAMARAQPQSEGLVAAADGGTLFLDEIEALTLAGQLKLLRLLQEKEYRRPGETRIRRVNIRVIAATSTNLPADLHNGRLCAELFNAFTCVYLRSMSVNTRQRQLVFVIH